MTSIFIWKNDTPNTSNKSVKIYSGSNWVLEESEYFSKSYTYLNQIVISESNNSVITFNIKNMPQDYVGSDLLEVKYLPYELIKSDNYGILERIGNWNRFTLNQEIDYTLNNLTSEYKNIIRWINIKQNNQNKNNQNKNYQNKNNIFKTNNLEQHTLEINTIQEKFKQFLNKYNTI
jgi:hypothetical protein